MLRKNYNLLRPAIWLERAEKLIVGEDADDGLIGRPAEDGRDREDDACDNDFPLAGHRGVPPN